MAKSVVGPWALDKLNRLRNYLNAYTTIMKEQRWCQGFYYIDAFAGPGKHEVRSRLSKARGLLQDVANFGQQQEEHRTFLAGSPQVALEIEHPFSAYVFVERSPSRVAALKKLAERYGSSRKIRIQQSDCNKFLRDKVVSNAKINWRSSRAVAFLDPFGMQVPWSTIELLGQTQAIEILLNFPVGMAIQRLLLRDTHKLTPARRTKLDNYFGSPDWFDTIYRKEQTLFGEATEEKIEKSGRQLLKWYRERLRNVFGHVSRAALFRNTRGGHLYYLMLASPNATGVKIANHILSAGETV
jgi:three-Cys-motif partner protein